jgi:GNAT superfamily N-acetyltransferase
MYFCKPLKKGSSVLLLIQKIHYYKMQPSIDILRNHPHFIPKLVDLLWEEWKDDYLSLTSYKDKNALHEFYSNTITSDSIPIAYVIFDHENFIGTLVVDVEDMGVHPECSPWLASVFIAPEYRGHGYATKLISNIVTKYPILHLWTFNERLANFYKRFGFITREIIPEHGHHSNIIYMTREM